METPHSISRRMLSTGHIITKMSNQELRYDSEIQVKSNLCITSYSVQSLTFKKSWDVMLSNSNNILRSI